VTTIAKSIRTEPEKWRLSRGGYRLVHDDGAELWVGNGLFFCGPNNAEDGYRLIDKWKTWRAFQWWCRNAPMGAMRKHDIGGVG